MWPWYVIVVFVGIGDEEEVVRDAEFVGALRVGVCCGFYLGR